MEIEIARTVDGRRLRAYREAANLSQPKLAAKAGVHTGTVWKYENEKHSEGNLAAITSIAKALDLTVDDLLKA